MVLPRNLLKLNFTVKVDDGVVKTEPAPHLVVNVLSRKTELKY